MNKPNPPFPEDQCETEHFERNARPIKKAVGEPIKGLANSTKNGQKWRPNPNEKQLQQPGNQSEIQGKVMVCGEDTTVGGNIQVAMVEKTFGSTGTGSWEGRRTMDKSRTNDVSPLSERSLSMTEGHSLSSNMIPSNERSLSNGLASGRPECKPAFTVLKTTEGCIVEGHSGAVGRGERALQSS